MSAEINCPVSKVENRVSLCRLSLTVQVVSLGKKTLPVAEECVSSRRYREWHMTKDKEKEYHHECAKQDL